MKKRTYITIMLVLAIGLCFGSFKIVSYYTEQKSAQELYNSLAQEIADFSVSAEQKKTEQTTDQLQQNTEQKSVLPEYAKIFEKNKDLVGWLHIDGTIIDYPVMQTPAEPNYYLQYDFNKNASVYGCLYAQEDCDIFAPSDNVIIYGHSMRDGMMFGTLLKYRDKSYWKEHKNIRFDTLYNHFEYEIFAVVPTPVDDSGLAYRQFVQAQSEDDFTAFVERCRNLSLYDTGVNVAYGDHLITLSTCEVQATDTIRLLVIAKRKGEI